MLLLKASLLLILVMNGNQSDTTVWPTSPCSNFSGTSNVQTRDIIVAITSPGSKKGIIANEDYVASAHFKQDCIRAPKSNSAQFQQKEANFILI